MIKHIQAYFKEWNDAESAGYDLRALGATDVTSDRAVNDKFGRDESLGFAFTANQSQANQVSRMPFPYPPGIVNVEAAEDNSQIPEDIDAAGIGTPVLSAKVEGHLHDQALEIVKKHGGWTNRGGAD